MTPEETVEMIALNVLAARTERDSQAVRSVVGGIVSTMIPPSTPGHEEILERVARRIEVMLEITMEDAAVLQLEFEPWLESRRAGVTFSYWSRYRRLLGNTLPPLVIGTIDKDTDRIVGLLQDPKRTGPWKRRGLAVGEVQSGKTGNYLGVACKAADYGYKFIVVLAGMQNNLRRQTQERVEDGFIGLDTDKTGIGAAQGKGKAWTGVGVLDQTFQPISLTTKASDFQSKIANAANISFGSVIAPIILVVKKQKRVLENLIGWLRSNNPATGGVICGVPMLLLDDEADNASINTREQGDPTQINRLIRELLNQFEQNAYLGYTATPFANIFIDPDTNDQMLREDLFPRDFIVALDAPTNYVGPSKVFLREDGDQDMIRDVLDHKSIFPEKHKIDLQVSSLPPSLLEAIRSFVLARAIRMIRGQRTDHNSMLVNVSRFNSVQRQVTALITDYLTELRNSIQSQAALPETSALEDLTLRSMRETWEKEFMEAEPDWAAIQAVLNEAVSPIVVRTINNKSTDVLDYRKRKENGLNVIAVGGLSLSRGFTLEGLTTSYFIRNSIMYDTLLQMGRWFGYRDGYVDLCHLYMTPEASSWYRHIAMASEELRTDIKRMEREQRTPYDFGLKVRTHPDNLIVTARNKMRSGQRVPLQISLSGELVETVFIRTDNLEANRTVFANLISRIDSSCRDHREKVREGHLWRGVESTCIKDFIRAWRNHEFSMGTQASPLIRLIESRQEGILGSWDVCLFDPDSDCGTEPFGEIEVHKAHRSGKSTSDYFQVSGKSSRVASRGNEKAGLTPSEIDRAKDLFRQDHPRAKQMNVSDRYFRVVRHRPLLMLHVLDIEQEPNWVPAWGISFPGSLPEEETIEYVVNTTWFKERAVDEEDEDNQENDEATDEEA